MPIINGRRVEIPNSGIYGKDLEKMAGKENGRRIIVKGKGIDFKAVRPNKLYGKNELYDKYGKPVKITTIPDRTKGGFGKRRSALSKQIIAEQVYDIATHLFKDGVDFDEDNADWVAVPNYGLPAVWHPIAKTRSTPLLIVFPTEYPNLPPIGFYMKADIPAAPGGHFYDQAYHDACKKPLQLGWRWYCVYIKPGSWRPARVRKQGDWKYGDNLWEYFSLIKEALASKD